MAVEHNTLTDPELHEPKGISTAAVGEVYVSDGAGSGTFEQATVATNTHGDNEILVGQPSGNPTWQLFQTPTLGRIDLINSSATIVLTGADIRLSGSYTDITSNFSQAINLGGMTFDGTNHIVVPRTGYYRVSNWISVSSSSASNPIIAMDLNVNGVSAFPGSAIVTKLTKTANDIVELVGFGEAQFTAGDVIGLGFASDGNTTLSIYDSVFAVVQIG